MNNKQYFLQKIPKIIQEAKSIPGWSISEYLIPIRKLYNSLTATEREEFRNAMLSLLKKNILLDNLLDICKEIRLKEACTILIKLLLNPPKGLEEDKHRVWIEGLQRQIIHVLGVLGCKDVIALLETLLQNKMRNKNSTRLPKMRWDSYGCIINAMANLSIEKAGKYFGWWIMKAQEIDRKQVTFLKKLSDWNVMEDMNIAPNINESLYGAGAVRQCILAVATKKKMSGLRQWLRSIELFRKEDRTYLAKQIVFLLEGRDIVCNLAKLVNFKGNKVALALELSSLPKIAEPKH